MLIALKLAYKLAFVKVSIEAYSYAFRNIDFCIGAEISYDG